jgi:hypothetical protein
MSIYRCNHCEGIKDADYHGCNEHPSEEFQCICDACLEIFPEDHCCIDDYDENN